LVDVVEEGVPSAIKVAVQDEVSPLPGRVDSSALPHPALGDGLVRDKQRSLRGGGVLSPVQEDLSQRFEADDLFLQSLHPTLSLLKRRASNATARQGGMRSQIVWRRERSTHRRENSICLPCSMAPPPSTLLLFTYLPEALVITNSMSPLPRPIRVLSSGMMHRGLSSAGSVK
jgi:hypothetical protein